jgi:hypothetical protein
MKIFLALAAVAAIASAGSASAVTNLVQNGDFSSLSNGLGQLTSASYGGVTTAPPWTSGGYNLVMNVADQDVSTVYGSNDFGLWDAADSGGANSWNGQAPGGANFVALDGDFDTGPLSQTITGLVAGKTYALTFDYAFGQQQGFFGPTVQTLSASVGASAWTSTPYALGSQGFSGWTPETFIFHASSASETLSFLASGNVPVPPFAMLANVQVLAAPEPGTWALLILGVGVVGGVARRRRALATAAI